MGLGFTAGNVKTGRVDWPTEQEYHCDSAIEYLTEAQKKHLDKIAKDEPKLATWYVGKEKTLRVLRVSYPLGYQTVETRIVADMGNGRYIYYTPNACGNESKDAEIWVRFEDGSGEKWAGKQWLDFAKGVTGTKPHNVKSVSTDALAKLNEMKNTIQKEPDPNYVPIALRKASGTSDR